MGKSSKKSKHIIHRLKHSKFYSKKWLIALMVLVGVCAISALSLVFFVNGADIINPPQVVEEWPGLLMKYKDDPNTSQLLFIKCEEGSSTAEAFYYIKTYDSDNWILSCQGKAYIGSKGLGKKFEGDRKTPEGNFNVTGAFGIKSNPGTCFDYKTITPYTVACDEDCEYYNQIIDINEVGFHRGEIMKEYSPQYNYGMTFDFNPDNVYPKGSNIFLHCAGSSRNTAGCIAIEESMMLEILTTATPGFKICIHEK